MLVESARLSIYVSGSIRMESRQEGRPYQQLPGTVEPALFLPLPFPLPLPPPAPPSSHIPDQNNLEGCWEASWAGRLHRR